MLLIPSFKNKSNIERISDSQYYYIPLAGYRGNLTPIVQVGEKISKYQLLAQSDGFFASQIHAPISGKVMELVEIDAKLYLKLENDFKEEEMNLEALSIDNIDLELLSSLLLTYGIEGAGGSRLPTTIKYKNSTNHIDTLIFNGVECEPYLTCDYALMKNKASELMKIVVLMQKLLNCKNIYFAVEKHNKDIKNVLLDVAKDFGLQIQIKLLPNSYPQGAELQLIQSVTGKELAKGTIPMQHGIIVNNIGTLWAIYKAVFENKAFTERIVTISGDSCSHHGNYLIKIGTPISHILKETNNLDVVKDNQVILGGPMMGKSTQSLLTPINKGSGGLLIMKQKNTTEMNCIKCGICVDVCPQRLMPLEFVRYNQSNDIQSLKSYGLLDCIECGACEYVCPSSVPLIENIFEGKKKINQHAK